ncbi:MAG: hypothetical protein ACYTGG_10160 [Planctomycetota bacterium]
MLNEQSVTAPGGGGGIANLSGSQAALSDALVCGNVPDQLFGQSDDNGGSVIADECPPDRPADLDGDSAVTTSDLPALLATWGTDAADPTGDGNTDTQDLLALLAGWGVCP